jgi:hypothetical protein
MLIDIRTSCPRCRASVSAEAEYCRICGHGLPGHQPEVTVTEPKAVAALLPTRPRTKTLTSLIAVGAFILAVSLPVLAVRWAFYGPDDSVRNYFAALADRDANAAWDYVADESARPSTTDAAVLRHTDYTPPTKFRLGAVTIDGKNAQAQVHYEVGGTAHDETLTLNRLGGPDHPYQRWHIANALQPLPGVASVLPLVELAGFPVLIADQTGGLQAFPGSYVMRLPDSPLIEADPVTVRTGEGSSSANLAPRLRSTAWQKIEEQIKTYLDGCVRRAEAAPSGCPFSYDSYYSLTSIAWRITQYPTYRYEVNPDESVSIVTTQPGVVEATGRTTSTYQPTVTARESLYIQGVARSDGTNVTFTMGE